MSLIKCFDKLLFYVITEMTNKNVRRIFLWLHRQKKYKSVKTKKPGTPSFQVTSPLKRPSVTPRKTFADPLGVTDDVLESFLV